ncbi:MAG: PilZ domain-containing protein [Mariprofundus sp.]|nr:PilZ domain-containing protein [Mariprofundus sp.]
MRNERRNQDRYCFNLDLHPEGELFLFVGDQTYEVWKLLDISPFGSCLSVDTNIEIGTRVVLHYQTPSEEIVVFGTVSWSDHENTLEEGAGFRMGVEFNRDTMLLNVSLFKIVTAPMLNVNPVATDMQGNRPVMGSLR